MKTSLTRLATIIAAAVFTVSSSPPNIGRGNYVYDPNSIPQNEKILKLFVRLAAHTANRLIQLKLKANPQMKALESYEDEMNAEPEILLQNIGEKIIHPISLKPDEQTRRSAVGSPDDNELQRKHQLPPYHEKYHQNIPKLPSARSEGNPMSEERLNDSENGVTDNPVNRLSLEEPRAMETPIENSEVVTDGSNRRKLTDEKIRDDDEKSESQISDEIVSREFAEVDPVKENVTFDVEIGETRNEFMYNDEETMRQPELLTENEESSTVNNFQNQPAREPYLADEEVELDTDSSVIPFEVTTMKSFDAVYSPSPKPRADFSGNVAVKEEPEEGEVELENRALFNIEKNNYVTHYSDQSTNINRADTTVMNGGSGQTGRVIVNQNAGSRPVEKLERIEQRGKIFGGGREATDRGDGVGQELAAGDVFVNQIAGSSGSQKTIGVDRSANENQAMTTVGNSDVRHPAQASFGFEKNIGIGIGMGMNRESMAANENSADLGQIATSNLRAATEAREKVIGGFTDGVEKIQKSGGAGLELQKELALRVQPKHSLTGSLLGDILSRGSQTEGSANMNLGNSMQQSTAIAREENASQFGGQSSTGSHMKASANIESGHLMQSSMKTREGNSGIFHGELNKEIQTKGLANSMQDTTAIAREENASQFGGQSSIGSHMKASANIGSGHWMQNSMKTREGNSGIFHGESNKEIQTKGLANMNLGNSMQQSTAIAREENASNFGDQLSIGDRRKDLGKTILDISMPNEMIIREENSGIFHGELNKEIQTNGLANMNLGNSMHQSTAIAREENASNFGNQLSTGGHMKGLTNMQDSQNSMQSSKEMGENEESVLRNKFNAKVMHTHESKMQSKLQESVAKNLEHEMHSYASAHEARQQGSMSQGNLQVGYEKSAHLASSKESGEASNAEKKLRQDSSMMTNQGTGLSFGAQIGLDLRHGANSNPSVSEKIRMANEDIHGSMNGRANIDSGSATKLEASKELSSTGFGLLNAKANLLRGVLNPVGKLNGKLNLSAHVLATS